MGKLAKSRVTSVPSGFVYETDGVPQAGDGRGVVGRAGLVRNTRNGRLFINVGTVDRPEYRRLHDTQIEMGEREPDVVWEPSPRDVVSRMLQVAAIDESSVLYDLGCGDGRIVIGAAKAYKCNAIGFDINPRRVAEARANIIGAGESKLAEVRVADCYTLDLSKADAITLYLLPEMNTKLIPQLQKAKPGCRIVCHDFPIRAVEPDEVHHLRSIADGKRHWIYVWRAPLKIAAANPGT